MAKQDVLDAINATIVPNGTKAITAQSLNNVLTMMTENAGEGGSGDGALRVIVPELSMFGLMIVETGEMSPTSWEEMKPLFEQEMGVDLSEYGEVVNASFAHNANVVQQIIEKGKAGQGVSVVLDQTPYVPALASLLLQVDPEGAALYEGFSMCGVQPAGLFMQYINHSPEGEALAGGDMFSCGLAPTGTVNLDGMDATYPSNMQIMLNLDGSLTFTEIEEEQPSSGGGVVTFYMPSDGENLTTEQKSKNAIGVDTLVKASSGGYTPPVSICTQISYGINQYQTPLLYVVTSEGIEIHLTAFNVSSGAFEENVFGISTDGSILKA